MLNTRLKYPSTNIETAANRSKQRCSLRGKKNTVPEQRVIKLRKLQKAENPTYSLLSEAGQIITNIRSRTYSEQWQTVPSNVGVGVLALHVNQNAVQSGSCSRESDSDGPSDLRSPDHLGRRHFVLKIK